MTRMLVVMVAVMGIAASGCKSNSKPKPTLERGWIGGEYEKAARKLVPEGQSGRVFVKQVYADTPAERAGLKPADLITAVNGHPVADLKQFRAAVDAATPGSHGSIQVFRNGKLIELPLAIGRETYQQWHAFSLGLGFSSKLDVLPDPNFTVLPLGKYKRSQDRVELRSPEVLLARQVNKEDSQGEKGARSAEGWDAWLLILGFNAHKRILTQEMAASSAMARGE
jgi:serine protease Do